MKKLFSYLSILIGFLLIWQLIIWLLALPPYILPSPFTVLLALYTHWHLIIQNLWPTVIETLLALIFGSVAGMMVALSLSYFRWARSWFLPMLLTSQALPIFAIAPLLVIWFGYGMASKILVAMLMIFFPVASAFYDGLRRTPYEWLELGQVMGGSRWRLLWQIRIPAAVPALASGLRVAATFAPMGAIIGEWVGSSSGLGFLMLNANARMQIDLMFAVLVILVLFTLILYFTLDLILKKIIFWRAYD